MTPAAVAALGYSVDVISAAYSDGDVVVPATYRVSGYGVDLYVSAADTATWDSLGDPAAHAARVDQFENGPPPPPAPPTPGPTVQENVAAALMDLPDGVPLMKADIAGVITALLGG